MAGGTEMYQVTLRVSDTLETIATGTGATWEEATFNGYDKMIRAAGQPRRYLAHVVEEPSPGRKVLRFGFRSPDGGPISGDQLVTIDVERLD